MKWLATTGNILLTMVVILVLMLGAGYIGLSLYDWNKLKPRIANALEDATGREVTIRGDITLELDLSPAIAVNDISVQNAEWGSRPKMMTIPHAELEIGLLSLLDERTEIERILIKKPTIILETHESGKLNLQPVTKTEQPEQPDKPPGFFVRKVRIENGDFTFRDHAKSRTFQGDVETFEARADSFGSPVRVDARGTYSGRDFSVDGNVGSQAGMLTDENEWRVDLNTTLGDAQTKIDGIIPINETADTGRLNLSIEGENLSRLMALFGVSVPNDGTFELTGKMVSGSEGKRWQVSGTGRLEEMKFKLDGSLPPGFSLDGAKADISAEGPNLSKLTALFGESVPVEKAFEITGKITREPDSPKLDVSSQARIGEMAFELDGSLPDTASLEGLEAELSAEGPNLSNLLALFGRSIAIDKPFDITGKVAQTQKENIWTVAGKGELDGMAFAVDGSVPDFTSLEGLNAEISVDGPNYSNLMALFGVSVTVESPFDLAGELNNPGSDRRLRAHLEGSIGEMALAFEGSIPGITEVAGLESVISVKGPDLSKFLALFTVSTPMEKAFDISTNFNYPDAMTFHLDEARAQIGDSDYTGRIRIEADEKPFSFIVDGASEHLNLAAVINNYTQEESGDTGTDRANGGKKQLIPDRPLPLDILKTNNSEIHLKAGTLLLPRLSLTEFRIDTTLQGGHLNVDTLQSRIGTGTIKGRVEVQSEANPPLITAVLNADSIRLDEMVRGMDPGQQIKGNMNINLDFSGSGKTYAELAADLSGKAGMNMSDGRLFNQYLGLLGDNIFSALIDILNPFDKNREYVDINCMVIRFDIEDGLAESTALILDTPEVAIVGDGKINLKTEEIKIPLNTIPKKNIGIKDVAGMNLSLSKFVDPLQIDGTLANPKVRVDVSSALFSIGKALGGVALFGPAGIAATLLSGSAGKQNACQAALEKNQQPDQ